MTPKRQLLMTRMSQCTLLYSAAGCSREEGCVEASGQLGGANHRDARAATPLLRNISRTRESCNRNLLPVLLDAAFLRRRGFFGAEVTESADTRASGNRLFTLLPPLVWFSRQIPSS